MLVDVHADMRLSIGRLASENGVLLAERYVVTRLATGCVDLAPDAAGGDDVRRDSFGVLVVDRRSRLRLTRAVLHRLAVPVGAKVLVTFQPAGETLRLLNLATLGDAVEARLAAPSETTAEEADDERR